MTPNDSSVSQRKIVAISTTPVVNNSNSRGDYIMTALCNDGTVWELKDSWQPKWELLTPIPQDEIEIACPK